MTRTRTPRLLAASALGLALVAVPALPAVAGDAAPTVTKDGSTYTLKVLETDDGSGDTFIPKGGEPVKGEPSGPPKAGDGFGFAAVLTQDGTKVGTDGGTCTVLSIDLDAQTAVNHCRVTLTFANGSFTVEGTVKFADEISTFDVPIVTGTGDYAGVTGTMTVHDLNDSSGDGEESDGPSQSDLTAVYTLGGSQVSEVPSGGAATGGGLDKSSDSALVIGLGGLVALAGFGALAGGRALGRREH